MRIMQVGSSHYGYLQYFARRFKKLSTHAELMRAYADDYYWCGHLLTPALKQMGHEVFVCVPTEVRSQALWCEEHGVVQDELGLQAFFAQVEWFKPDILYISSAAMYHDAILQHLTWRPPCIVGWHAGITWEGDYFKNYDLVLSSHEECLFMARKHGARNTAFAYPGVPAELKAKVASSKHTDVCFSGYWAVSHPRRNQFLLELAERLPALDLDCAYHLSFYNTGPACPDAVLQHDRGAVWGLSMYRAFAAARVVLNGYASINHGPQNMSPNLRQMEAMGVGSFLLTEQSDNISAFFTEGEDLVTYASTEELADKALYYARHEEERERIAAQGYATCVQNYSRDIRARAFLEAVQRIQTKLSPPERVGRALKILHDAHSNNASGGTLDHEDVRALLKDSLETVRVYMLGNDRERALPLLEGVEALGVEGLAQLDFCRALRALGAGDRAEGERLLRRELAAWPGNDAARHALSRTVLGQNV